MARPISPQTEEPGSRGDDWKDEAKRREGNSGGNASDGKFEDTPQGGKRRGPGRWEIPSTPKD